MQIWLAGIEIINTTIALWPTTESKQRDPLKMLSLECSTAFSLDVLFQIGRYVVLIEYPLVVLLAVGPIPHSGLMSYFSFQPVFRNCYNKDRGMCYPVCGMLLILFYHISDALYP